MALAVPPIAELQVLEAVVAPIAVDVMNGFVGCERSAEAFRHEEPVLSDVSL